MTEGINILFRMFSNKAFAAERKKRRPLKSSDIAIVGKVPREWQDQKTILEYFGSELAKARKDYESFVEEGVALGRRPELVGGGLVRSLGDWFQVVSMRRKGATISSDARILGGSDFVDRILSEAKEQEKETLRFAFGKCALPTLLATIAKEEGVAASAIRTGIRKRAVVKARKLISQIAVRRFGYAGAEVARYLNISTAAVNRLVGQEELPDIERYIKLF